MMTAVTKEKIKALLRQQVEYCPEPAIAQLERGDAAPAISLLCKINRDLLARAIVIHTYSDKIAQVALDAGRELGI